MFVHIPVMLHECIDGLSIHPDGIYVDFTTGRGGHSSEILKTLNHGKGHLYCFDTDIQAIIESKDRLSTISDKFTMIHDNFENLEVRLREYNVEKIDGGIFDLGVSSAQFDDGSRGFSYRFDAKLDMRMNQDATLNAEKVVNTYSLADLARIIKEYGEEPYAYQIAKEIVRQRNVKPIETTFELVEIIKKALPKKVLSKKGHPAKQTFQAIRIEVNNELNVLEKALRQACSLLNEGGRIAVLTFQSAEDKIVKKIFKELTDEGEGSRVLPVEKKKTLFSLVNRKVIQASEEELKNNNRAHSAKLRIIERRKDDERKNTNIK